jgi:signal transduction protein with GAF and PtsI domain
MNIQSAKYYKDIITEENVSINIVVDGQEMSVPLDPDNRHYQAIQEWVKEGNKIEDAD